MKNKLIACWALIFLGLVNWLPSNLHAQGTTFTYQGRLDVGGTPANGMYNFNFRAFNALTDGASVGGIVTVPDVGVTNGLFTVMIPFNSGTFNGSPRWLEIGVTTNGGGSFTTLAPRQPITATPYAILAGNVSGVVALAQLPAAIVTNGASGINIAGTFTGNGAGVTNINLAANSGGAFTTSGGFPLSAMPNVGPGPRSVAAADVNGDGKIDLISANYGPNGTGNTLSILTNNGAGSFTLAATPGVGPGPISVIATDVNGDHQMDLVCANFNGGSNNTLSILINNGTGGFTPASAPIVGAGPISVIAADVNGDGKMDLISANFGTALGNTLSVLTNNGTGGFVLAATLVVGSGPIALTATEINGDNKLDLACANFYGNSVSVLTNSGNGTFGLAAPAIPITRPNAIAAMDVDNNGKMDLIVSDPANDALRVLTNAGSGNFALAFSPSLDSPYNQGSANSVVTADVNGDGKLDLICANSLGTNGNTLSLLINDRAGNFVLNPLPLYVGRGPYSVVAADVSGDGRPDLICANFGANTLSVLLNSATATGIVQSTGPIASPMWNASTPIAFGGALPSTSQFNTGGGTLLITASGSGYTTVANTIGMNLLLDDVLIGSCQIFANQVNSHLAFVPKTFVQKGVPAGAHSISLQPLPGTLSNGNDNYSVTVIEFPF